jgi:cobalamin synthase
MKLGFISVETLTLRITDAENPTLIHEVPLLYVTIGAWGAISATKIIWPILFVSSCSHITYILTTLYYLSSYKRTYAFFRKTVKQHTLQKFICVILRMLVVTE